MGAASGAMTAWLVSGRDPGRRGSGAARRLEAGTAGQSALLAEEGGEPRGMGADRA